ncbi:hypothetical protein NM688_g2107 [Phlebia brevispora]|uniref:Uncharacterized protein n=1 Tax=Phlebia brevispora TaxID=194682 RepID=A0ACC1T9U2_9APHY|nr:hypothetical protein NM688_g2107 [Phlebia brevispora]
MYSRGRPNPWNTTGLFGKAQRYLDNLLSAMPTCPNILATGTCNVQGCRDQHDVRKCSCGIFVRIADYEAHVSGRRHRQILNDLEQQQQRNDGDEGTSTRCYACRLEFASREEFSAHQRTRTHRDAVAKLSTNEGGFAPVTGQPAAPGYLLCNVCQNLVHVDVWISHTTRHISYQRRVEVEAAFAEAEKDKHGLVVSYKKGINFGIMDLAEALREDMRRIADVKVQNTGSATIGLHSVKLSSSSRGDHYGERFSASVMGKSRRISPGASKTVAVTFHPSYEGQHEDTLELVFHHLQLQEQFVITRRIQAIVGSEELHERLKAKGPYVRPKFSPYEQPRKIVRVHRPPTWSYTKWAVKLPEFKAPGDLVNAAFGPKPSATVRPFIPPFNIDNYGRFWQALLWIEEEKMRRDLDLYSMKGVNLDPERNGYRLKVAGLAEGRPSVIVGDMILVRHAGDETGVWYEGCVHELTGISVFVRFNAKFKGFKGTKVDVKFVLNRLPDRRMHQAVVSPFNPPRLLFPTPGMTAGLRCPTSRDTGGISLVDRNLAQNEEQLQAIAAITLRPPGSVPFIVFGPPGTGKTVTIVEAIRQLITLNPEAKVLACAPSNSAADLLAVKLTSTLNPRELFRLNAYARPFNKLMSGLQDFSLYNDNGIFAIPELKTLTSYRVIVSTCISAGVPHALGVNRGHFTHIFVDEAGQATEPMSMIGIKTYADEKTNVILAGDDKQLNPITHSPLARGLGLGRSYLERLMKLPMYDEHEGRGVTVMKLIKHFRSHPDILYFPNQQFYKGELQPCADPIVTHSLARYEGLVKQGFPMIFHGIVGKDQREESSPSFFNVDEVALVIKYAMDLVENRKLRVDAEKDIGIIAPYHAQCQKILAALPRKLRGVKVGSVEEFQGQERRVIIISTVRSSTNFVGYDVQRTLGFVANPRRFNVAVTRAKSLLIVVGNPDTLSLDPMWRTWLNYVHQKGGCRGKEITWQPEEPVQDGGYDEKVREKAQAEIQEIMERIRSKIMSSDSWALWEDEDSGSDDEEDPTIAVEIRVREAY